MKIRNGFVSNSSSSSFLIYGINPKEDLMVVDDCDMSDDAVYEAQDKVEKELGKAGIEFHDICGEAFYYGLSLREIQDDETMGEFKKRVEKTLKEFFGAKIKGIKFDFHQEAWRDG